MKHRAYLDIETTGLSRYYSELTVVGIALERGRKLQVMQFIEDEITMRNILTTLEGVDEIYTYNGSRFDLPFIKAKLRLDLSEKLKHRDLMYDCWRKHLKGGLKVVEQVLGIDRTSKGIDGYMAIRLWWDYVKDGDEDALKTLLAYNKEDVVNLSILRRKLAENVGESQPTQAVLPFVSSRIET